jgi:hypothetical protein
VQIVTLLMPDKDSIFRREVAFYIGYDPTVPCVVAVWRGFQESMSFRAQNEAMLKALIGHRATKLLCDCRYMFQMSSADRDWLNDNYLPRMTEAGLRSCALLEPVYYANNVAVRAVAERIDSRLLTIRYFNDPDVALDWLREASPLTVAR